MNGAIFRFFFYFST
ncbi:pheST operon leader peptide PheM [Enterobacter hormaechei]|nr:MULTISPECIES: pheST operon leader peptide PheM [Enterobacteriaceae]EGH6090220.1 pheST operon leader peptide PheM [Salmonella enterica]MCX0059219.1 pheST operon leader peptide PheM [Escherichia coli]